MEWTTQGDPTAVAIYAITPLDETHLDAVRGLIEQ